MSLRQATLIAFMRDRPLETERPRHVETEELFYGGWEAACAYRDALDADALSQKQAKPKVNECYYCKLQKSTPIRFDKLDANICLDCIVSVMNELRAQRMNEKHQAHSNISCELENQRRIDALQYKIDTLMLEYCPDEMTVDQKLDWASHQRPAPNTDI